MSQRRKATRVVIPGPASSVEGMNGWNVLEESDVLRLLHQDGAVRVELRRPDSLNAFDDRLAVELLDALRRLAADHAYGHIPGSLLLPEEEFEERFAALKPRLERAQALVVYCSSRDCGKSLWTALRLWNTGLKQVRIFPGGWNEWYLRELPVERTATR